MLNTPTYSGFHLIRGASESRKIAYSDNRRWDAEHTFLCLPGLLETRANFAPFMALSDRYASCRCISVDFCGRGDSDPLPDTLDYSMSVYLADMEDFVHHQVLNPTREVQTALYLVGTSMGGVLAMYLAGKLGSQVSGLILNDVGLSLHWSSLIQFYKDFSPTAPERASGTRLQVDPRVIRDVQSPRHFDLHYAFDLLGMHFQGVLHDFHGQVLLVHNSHSVLCPSEIAQRARKHLPQMAVLTVNAEHHPVTWTEGVCEWVAQTLKLQPAANHHTSPALDRMCQELLAHPMWQAQVQSPTTPIAPTGCAPIPCTHTETLNRFIETSCRYLSQPPEALTLPRWFKAARAGLSRWSAFGKRKWLPHS